MKASSLEFRFRFLIHFVLVLLGFTAPWNQWLHVDSSGPNAHVWGTLSADNIVWGTAGPGENIVWGTADNIVWGTFDSAGNIVIKNGYAQVSS